MKKLLGTLIAAVGFASMGNAAVLINEPFSYADGGLTNVSSGVWTNHSGANSGSVMVSGGAITLVTTAAEDVMRPLGVSYTSQTIFASFKVNFSVLPTATTYFAHLAKDSTTFRCRIWSTTNGAATGKFRLAITSSVSTAGAWVPVTTDLDLNTEYKVVVRLVGGTSATLWINPTSESSIVNRADGTDTATLGTWASQYFAFRQSSGMGTMTIDDLLVGDQFSDVQTVGGPPSISGLVATNISANSTTGPMPFVVSDVETAAASLAVTATSDNPTLVPNSAANLVFGGSGGNRTLTVIPAAGQQGTATITTIVTDADNFTATNSFLITVGAPSISSIANQIALTNTVSSVNLWVNDKETAPGSLTVTATSSDQSVLPDANIAVINPGTTNRTLLLTNAGPGKTTLTVTVNDGTFNIPTVFILTAFPDIGIQLEEPFDMANGPLSVGTAPDWNTHSGTVGQTLVTNGKLMLVNTNSEDVNRWFSNAPISSVSGVLLHSRFVINLSELPTANSTGEYFAHAYAFSGIYRGRIFCTTNGAAPGKYRISVSNGGYVTTVFPQDFSTNEDHVVISRLNTGTSETTLWVDPTSENSPHVSATDVWSPADSYYGYAFRQQTGIGSMSIDKLLIGSTFSEVLLTLAPTPEPIAFHTESDKLIMSWNQSSFSLASSTNVAGPYIKISGATSPYTNSTSGDAVFFRLVYP